MTIYVTDANIFIDLIYAGLLDIFPLTDMKLVTTLLIIDELDSDQQEKLQALVAREILTIMDVDLPEIVILNLPNGLSLPDKSVLCLAIRENSTLLSGDGLVRRTAEQLGLNVYGLLWLFDELVNAELMPPKTAIEKLKFLIEEKGSRQPSSECEKRFEKWKKQ